jgi:hypothetical protein
MGMEQRCKGACARSLAPSAAGETSRPVGRSRNFAILPYAAPDRQTIDQRWAVFLRNHARLIIACDFCVVVTAGFRILYVFVVMEHATRRLIHLNAIGALIRRTVSPSRLLRSSRSSRICAGTSSSM